MATYPPSIIHQFETNNRPHHAGPSTAFRWFNDNLTPNTTSVLSGDNLDVLTGALLSIHRADGDTPIVVGDCAALGVDTARQIGAQVITVSPDTRLAGVEVDATAPMVCIDLSPVDHSNTPALTSALCAVFELLGRFLAGQDRARTASGEHTPRYAVFVDLTLGTVPLPEQVHYNLDVASRNYCLPTAITWYITEDLDVLSRVYSAPRARSRVIDRAGMVLRGYPDGMDLVNLLRLPPGDVERVIDAAGASNGAASNRSPYRYDWAVTRDANSLHDLTSATPA